MLALRCGTVPDGLWAGAAGAELRSGCGCGCLVDAEMWWCRTGRSSTSHHELAAATRLWIEQFVLF